MAYSAFQSTHTTIYSSLKVNVLRAESRHGTPPYTISLSPSIYSGGKNACLSLLKNPKKLGNIPIPDIAILKKILTFH